MNYVNNHLLSAGKSIGKYYIVFHTDKTCSVSWFNIENFKHESVTLNKQIEFNSEEQIQKYLLFI